MSVMLISVTIVTFNSSQTIDRCLKSLHAQVDPPRFEVIVVDNSSTDDTAEKIKCNYPNVQLIESATNVGFGTAQNRASKSASGEFLLILNPDTSLEPDALARFSELCHTTDMLVPQLRFENGSLQRSIHRKWPSAWSHFYLYNMLLFFVIHRVSRDFDPTLFSVDAHQKPQHPMHAMGAAMLLRRSAFHDVHGFNDNFFLYLEETDLCFRLKARGFSITYLPEIVITHTLGASIDPGILGQASPHFMASSYRYFQVRKGKTPRFLFTVTWAILFVNHTILCPIRKIFPNHQKLEVAAQFTQDALTWHRSDGRALLCTL